MGELTERLLIAAPPELVYELVDDPARFAEWQPYLKSVVERAGRNDGIGSSFGAVYRVFGRRLLTHWVITAAEHGRLLETSGTVTGGWAHWRFALEPAADSACRLSSTLEYDMPGAMFAGPVAAVAHVVLARRFRETIDRLRTLAEAEAVERARQGPALSADDGPPADSAGEAAGAAEPTGTTEEAGAGATEPTGATEVVGAGATEATSTTELAGAGATEPTGPPNADQVAAPTAVGEDRGGPPIGLGPRRESSDGISAADTPIRLGPARLLAGGPRRRPAHGRTTTTRFDRELDAPLE